MSHPDYAPKDHMEARAKKPAPVQEPVAFKVIKGELCYKSEEDDQSFGMWCPVTPQTDLPFVDGTEFYTTQPASQPELQERVVIDRIVAEHGYPKEFREFEAALKARKATPPAAQRQWVGLTEDEQDELVYNVFYSSTRMELAIGIEAKLREKNLGESK